MDKVFDDRNHSFKLVLDEKYILIHKAILRISEKNSKINDLVKLNDKSLMIIEKDNVSTKDKISDLTIQNETLYNKRLNKKIVPIRYLCLKKIR